MVGIDILFLGMMAFCGVLTYVYCAHEDPSLASKLTCGSIYGLSFLAEKFWPETIIMLMMQISLCFFYALWLKFDW
jgi:hypothetical protein